ncbi:NAD(P)-dependent oxidoreductase [Streptomyces cucumeris]|uniref:NAD(P)-dependent oxidoreductase n=1 Tax=Streptomyces cucumeris TaxID=2962890 RepID=UPI003D703268
MSTELITVFGATGRTGRALLDAAARRGLATVAYSRSAHLLSEHAATRIVAGAADNQDAVTHSLQGARAAVLAYAVRGRSDVFSTGTRTVVHAMRALGVSRLVVVSESAYGEHLAGATLLKRAAAGTYQLLRRHAMAERRVQDEILVDSGLSWTTIRAPLLRDRPAQGRPAWHLTPQPGFPPTSTYEDLADLVLTELENPATFRRNLYC